MISLTLKTEIRKVLGKQNKQLREKNILPGVVYGAKTESLSLQMSARDFREVYKKAGDTDIINLEIQDGKKKEVKQVLVKDVVRHHITSLPIHVDFYEIEKGKSVTTHVPLVFEGESPGVKQGGILVKSMDEVEIECLPKDLPHQISVDISSLTDFDQTIYIKDIKIPSGVKILVDLDTPIITLTAPITEEELEEELGKGKEVEGVEVEAVAETEGEAEAKREGEEEKKATEPEKEEKSKTVEK